MGIQVLEALRAAHSIGLVHRDVKPGNIMVLNGDDGDRAKLVDFGIAQAVAESRLTRHGVAGSTAYMAPELFQGQEPSPAADLWALGVTLLHAVRGANPFDRGTDAATLHAILYDDLPRLDVPSPLAEMITGLLTRDAAKRSSGRQAAAVLEAAMTGRAEVSETREPTRVSSSRNPPALNHQMLQTYSDLATAMRVLLERKAAGSAETSWEQQATTIRPRPFIAADDGRYGSTPKYAAHLQGYAEYDFGLWIAANEDNP